MNEANTGASASTAEIGGDDVHILLVEDNPDDAELTLHAIRAGRVVNHVRRVKNGAEALDYLFRRGSYQNRSTADPNVVLLDLKLPLVDGIEVLRKIKAETATRRIPVVVLTSSAEDRDLERCYELGANSYIVKPVSTSSFFDAVSAVGYYWLALNRPAGP